MTEQMTVKYYYHSGFSVASGETLLVFDYWMGRQGKKLPAAQRITPETLSHFSEVFVFISHGHEDHFDPGCVYMGAVCAGDVHFAGNDGCIAAWAADGRGGRNHAVAACEGEGVRLHG